MRKIIAILGLFFASLVLLQAASLGYAAEEGAKQAHKPANIKVKTHGKEAQTLEAGKPEHQKALIDAWLSGEIEEMEVEHPPQPLAIIFDLGLWTIVVFVLLLIILRKAAWGPMLEGLKKREESILGAVEEAKHAREETARVTAEFKAKMEQAYAEIPKMMAEARREAEAFKEETRAQTAKEMQAERQRLRREIDTAKDQALQEIWTQAAQLATLISAKAIGKSLSMDDHHRLIDEAMDELREAARR